MTNQDRFLTLADLSAKLLDCLADPDNAALPVVSACRNLDGTLHGVAIHQRELRGDTRPCVVVW